MLDTAKRKAAVEADIHRQMVEHNPETENPNCLTYSLRRKAQVEAIRANMLKSMLASYRGEASIDIKMHKNADGE